jgi:hypothetical protein
MSIERVVVKNFLSVGAVFKDEARYLDEWLTFHSYMGVEKFYLYDDSSSDNFEEVLAPWIKAGRVRLFQGGNRKQYIIYRDCLRRARFQTKWLALIDLDEFLWSPTGETVSNVIRGMPRATGICVRWQMFGSSGHTKVQAGSALENFTRCLPLGNSEYSHIFEGLNMRPGVSVTGSPLQGKTIFRPSFVALPGVHHPIVYFGRLINEVGKAAVPTDTIFRGKKRGLLGSHFWKESPAEILRINHYWSRSIEELEGKVRRKFTGTFRPGMDKNFGPSLEGYLTREKHFNAEENTEIQKVWAKAKSAREDFLKLIP